MRTLRVSFLTLLALALSSSTALSQASPLHGIDVVDLDRKADPCNDFFEFANGTWRANNPIPASMTRWSKRWAAGESPGRGPIATSSATCCIARAVSMPEPGAPAVHAARTRTLQRSEERIGLGRGSDGDPQASGSP